MIPAWHSGPLLGGCPKAFQKGCPLDGVQVTRGTTDRSINQLGTRSRNKSAHRTTCFYFVCQNYPNGVFVHVESFPRLCRADNITSDRRLRRVGEADLKRPVPWGYKPGSRAYAGLFVRWPHSALRGPFC